jgi:hypothetical protein
MTSRLLVDKIEGKASSGTIQMPAGMVIQTVSLATTSGITRLQTASNTFVATGLSNSITPKFANSKINVRCAVAGNTNQTNGNQEGFYITFFRKIGSGSFSNIRSTSNEHGIGQLVNMYSRTHVPMLLEVMDAPNTLSVVEYKLYVRTFGSAADVEIPPGTEEHVEFILQEISQ